MKIEVIAQNRFGITQEVLAGLADHQLDLAAVEVVTEHIYIDVPALMEEHLPELSSTLCKIQGVEEVRRIDLLPDERRRLHLDALLSTLPDPVFAVDATGRVLSANVAATKPLGVQEKDLIGTPIRDILVGDNDYTIEAGSPDAYSREVTLAGQPYLLELKSIRSLSTIDGSHSKSTDQVVIDAGSMLILQAPTRLGHHISKVQMGRVNGFDTIAGQSPPLLQAKERAQRFASINAPLLIQGETGTGKELFARAVHQSGPWHSAAFLALNCATLPENLVESELFGYASGAFSGATRGGKPGLFELADGGTVFLDEIGEMSLYVQAKLLRFIQDGSFRRVGGKDERNVKTRIICATHRNLEQLVSQGQFREDLMYRLNVLNLQLPTLRERRDDIAPLSELFVAKAATQIGCKIPALSSTAKHVLAAHPWPGNVRQLENILFRTVALTQGNTIGPDELRIAGINTDARVEETEPESWKAAQAAFEKDLLAKLYQRYPSTRKLAQRLGVSHTTIADKLRTYNIAK
jgi:transcriptional regulator of aroF, aroG, tyrA and aromatic amino acid transport